MIPQPSEIAAQLQAHIDRLGQAAQRFPYSLSAANTAARIGSALMAAARELVAVGEPIAALRLLETAPPWVKHSGLAHLREVLRDSTVHGFSFARLRDCYGDFATSAPGGGPLRDRSLLEIDRYAVIAAMALACKPKSVLNIGCGDGTFDDAVLSYVPTIERWMIADIADVDDVVIALSERHPNVSVNWRPVMHDQFDYPTQKADLVIASEVIEHLKDQEDFLVACRQRGDRVIISTPDANVWTNYRDIDKAANGEYLHHIRANTMDSLVEMAADAGLKPLAVELTAESSIVAIFERAQ